MTRRTRRALILILSFSLLFPTTVLPQTEKQTSPEGVQGTLEYRGVVDPKQLPPPQPLPPDYPVSVPSRHPHGDAFRQYQEQLYRERLEQKKKGTVTTPPSPGSMAPLDPPVAVLANNFAGLQRSESLNATPPDTQVAAGPNHVLEAVNLVIRIFDKSGNVILTRDLFSFFGLDPATVYLSDPRVRFDTVSGRWFISVFAWQTASGTVQFAVSLNSDPTQPFNLYSFITVGGVPEGGYDHYQAHKFEHCRLLLALNPRGRVHMNQDRVRDTA